MTWESGDQRLLRLRVSDFLRDMWPVPGIRGREKMWDCPMCGFTIPDGRKRCENPECHVVKMREALDG